MGLQTEVQSESQKYTLCANMWISMNVYIHSHSINLRSTMYQSTMWGLITSLPFLEPISKQHTLPVTSIPNIVTCIIIMVLNTLSCMIRHIHLKMPIYLSFVKHNIIMFTTKWMNIITINVYSQKQERIIQYPTYLFPKLVNQEETNSWAHQHMISRPCGSLFTGDFPIAQLPELYCLAAHSWRDQSRKTKRYSL